MGYYTPMMAPRLIHRYRAAGFGAPAAPLWAEKSVDGTTYRLLSAAERDRLLSTANLGMGDPPTGPLQYAGLTVPIANTHVTSPGGTTRSAEFLNAMRRAGYGVIATKVGDGTPIAGATLPPGTEVAVATRDLAFVGTVTKADPKALVLFEPTSGWGTPRPTPRMLYAALAIGVLGVATYLLATRNRA